MDPSAALALRFQARVHAGLPKTMDESNLVQRLRPHAVHAVIERHEGESAPRSTESSRHLYAPLAECLAPGEALVSNEETDSKRTSVSVALDDLQELERLKDKAADSGLWATIESPFGQLPRLSVAYQFRASLADDLWQCFRKDLADIEQFARIHGVSWREERTSGTRTHVQFTLKSDSLENIQRVRVKLEATLTSEPFVDPVLATVFKKPSEWKEFMEELKAQTRTSQSGSVTSCCRENLKQRLIWIYGEKQERLKLITRIKQLCMTRRPHEDCCVCKELADPQSITFRACEHTACLPCIRLGVTASSKLPLQCPAAGCGRELHVQDIIKIMPDVQALVELAVFNYVADHLGEYAVCPLPGCNQILRRQKSDLDDRTPDILHPTCESCRGSYCLECSEATGSVAPSHQGIACADARFAFTQNVDHHAHFIRDRILTLKCPHCHSAFFDFEDCMSVSCSNVTCSRQFCACCLAFSDTNAKAMGKYVRTCAKSVVNGSNTECTDQLKSIHRDHRQQKLNAYLEAHVPSREARRLILELLAKDLSDLGLVAATFDAAYEAST